MNVMKWTSDWMMQDVVTGIVLVILNPDTKDVMERWQFEVSCDKPLLDEDSKAKSKLEQRMTVKDIQRQIGAVLKQIVASVSLLPATSLDSVCSFNILVYTKDNLDVPADWQESSAQTIPNAQQLRFRQVHTSVHSVESSVTYRAVDSSL
ncbi:putative Mitotic spindle assembly checkpoint protein MAD2A [Hypsibius exemplaris]|uniref:Mitotic spindle assembly checkpoint protein MAD2A n=1 Tax=Hypsibius exemplaris TaxID=2072580 RepID=A0A1W0WJF6_HYPEX|nr:putative Mitotic spindle assembly checkpoint protein MAD2A [Hypsibius exemplaris]